MRPHPGDDAAVMTIECPRCGHVDEATRAEIVRGAWRDCPVCTPSKVELLTPAQLIARHSGDDEAA